MVIPPDQRVVVLKWTTPTQLDLIAKVLAFLSDEVSKIRPEIFDNGTEEEIEFVTGLINLLADLDIPGYEGL